jgi:hypothetical protein
MVVESCARASRTRRFEVRTARNRPVIGESPIVGAERRPVLTKSHLTPKVCEKLANPVLRAFEWEAVTKEVRCIPEVIAHWPSDYSPFSRARRNVPTHFPPNHRAQPHLTFGTPRPISA